MKKKRALTLLEISVAICLLGILLTGLFNIFRQGITKTISAKELKQKVVQLELFQQKMRTLFAVEESVWIDTHPDSAFPALFVAFKQTADPDVKMCGEMVGMLYLNKKKELRYVSWSSEWGSSRVETLLENIETWTCHLFESKQGTWSATWPHTKKEPPTMANIKLTWDKSEVPFVFFLRTSDEKILYSGQP